MVPPCGIEPQLQAPQACVLSVERQGPIEMCESTIPKDNIIRKSAEGPQKKV